MLLTADLLCVSEQALQFARGSNFISARHTTVDTGIADLLPAADIDEYVFEPCGYSMNGLQGGAFSTIHVTPEAACSYASVELTGCMHEDVAAFVAKVRPPYLLPCNACSPSVPPICHPFLDGKRIILAINFLWCSKGVSSM